LLVATARHVTKSTLFLLIGSPQLLSPRQPDWVEHELATYLSSHEADPKVILVDFGQTVENALLTRSGDAPPQPMLREVEPFLRISEALEGLARPPSDPVLDAVQRNLDGRRRDRTRLRFFQGTAAVLAGLLAVVVALGLANERARKYAEARRLVVEARASLASPPATQLAIAQARGALKMSDSSEARDLARQVIDRLMIPLKIFPTPEIENVALFGAFRSDGKILVDNIDAGLLLAPAPDGSSWSQTGVEGKPGCGPRSYSADGERASCLMARRVEVWNISTGGAMSSISSCLPGCSTTRRNWRSTTAAAMSWLERKGASRQSMSAPRRPGRRTCRRTGAIPTRSRSLRTAAWWHWHRASRQ
jgi:hypothetical protein